MRPTAAGKGSDRRRDGLARRDAAGDADLRVRLAAAVAESGCVFEPAKADEVPTAGVAGKP